MFTLLYDRVLGWARHRFAVYYLAALSFAESSFFPIPPDVMLAPMSLAKPNKALGFALLTTIASVLGGLLGYAIGFFSFESVEPLLHKAGYWDRYLIARQWFDEWGFWAVFLAGFSPIPYKLFTISAGAMGMALLPFTLASFVGRGARFFLVALLLAWGGEPLEKKLRIYMDRIGWTLVAMVVLGLGIYYWMRQAGA